MSSKSFEWRSNKTVYKFIKKIGRGGNGEVYKVKGKDGKDYALKILLNSSNRKAYHRFRDEIFVLYQLKGLSSVVPIIDSYLPDNPDKAAPPFYVMPLGVPLTEYLQKERPEELFKHFIILSDGLEKLHDRDVTHRDIKPANLLVINGLPVFSDFGLANFPKKNRISSFNESIGAKWTIAPEMQRISNTAEYKKADIYSLAKSLWILITGNSKAFEGQYVAESQIGIKEYIDLKINVDTVMGKWYYLSVVLLEKLLTQATSNDPIKRPDAKEFVRQLLYWFNSNDDYKERNPYEWENAIDRIFPLVTPSRCEWQGAENIVKILSILLEYDSLVYLFLPDRGGDHLRTIILGKETNEILINDSIVIYPQRLLFELIHDDKLWAYFRLESEELTPISDSEEKMEYLFYGENGPSPDWQPGSIERDRVVSGCIIFTYNSSYLNFANGRLDGHKGYHSTVDADLYKSDLTKYKEQLFNTAIN